MKTQVSSLALGGLGLALLLGGAALLFSRGQSREVARVDALPVARPEKLGSLSEGVELLLEGRLLAMQAVSEQGFVAYQESYFLRRDANSGREEWGRRSVPLPPLEVEDAGQRVTVCNRDYLLVAPPHVWQSEVVPRSGDLAREATRRQQGFKPGDWVTIDGEVSRSGAAGCVHAKALFGGDAAGYRAEQRNGVFTLRVVGGVFSALGALVLALFASRWRKR